VKRGHEQDEEGKDEVPDHLPVGKNRNTKLALVM
jgi:hypothetical protein